MWKNDSCRQTWHWSFWYERGLEGEEENEIFLLVDLEPKNRCVVWERVDMVSHNQICWSWEKYFEHEKDETEERRRWWNNNCIPLKKMINRSPDLVKSFFLEPTRASPSLRQYMGQDVMLWKVTNGSYFSDKPSRTTSMCDLVIWGQPIVAN